MDDDWIVFERAWTRQVVASVNAARAAAGITVKQLAAALRGPRVGWPISDATLAGMLSGGKRTSISIAEIAAFASALHVPPMYLILGLPVSAELPAAALWPADEGVAEVLDWFAAYPDRLADQKEIAQLGVVSEQSECVTFIRERVANLMAANEEVRLRRLDPEDAAKYADVQTTREIIGDLSNVREDGRRLGMVLPALPGALAFVDSQPTEIPIDLLPQLESLVDEASISHARERLQAWVRQYLQRPRPQRSARDRGDDGER